MEEALAGRLQGLARGGRGADLFSQPARVDDGRRRQRPLRQAGRKPIGRRHDRLSGDFQRTDVPSRQEVLVRDRKEISGLAWHEPKAAPFGWAASPESTCSCTGPGCSWRTSKSPNAPELTPRKFGTSSNT